MRKCKDCGKELPEGSLFCQYCGSSNIDNGEEAETVKIDISDDSDSNLGTLNSYYSYQNDYSEKPKRGGKRLIIIVLIAALITALLFPLGFRLVAGNMIVPNQTKYEDFYPLFDRFSTTGDVTDLVIYAKDCNSLNYSVWGFGYYLEYDHKDGDYFYWTIYKEKLGFGLIVFSDPYDICEIKFYVGS